MENILERLKEEVLVIDGAMGTMLQANGLKPGECPDGWNLSHPDIVKSIHRTYIEAGCQLIITNTFGANRLKLERPGLAEKTSEINEAAAGIAREAAGDSVSVCGDVGPTGEFMEPLGKYTEDNFYEVFYEQISALTRGGADLIIVETMTDLREAGCAVRAAKAVSGIPVIGSMTFQKVKDGFRTIMGQSPGQMVSALQKEDCDIIGSNCGSGPEQLVEITGEIKSALGKSPVRNLSYILAEPNAGLPRLVNGETVFDQSPEDFSSFTLSLIEAGANIVGGCCGTTPGHIKAVAKVVGEYNRDL